MKTAVIFDMDGVIFDSERATYLGWKEIAEKYGLEQLDVVYYPSIGVNPQVCKQNFLNFYGKDFPYDQYKAEQSANYHKKYDGGNLPLKEGIVDLLKELQLRGIPCGVASSTRTALVKQQLTDGGLRDFFQVVVGGDMVQRSKPAPDIFLKASELLDSLPENTYVIEDSYNGIRAGKAAGMRPIMVPDMLPANEEMEESAYRICNHLSEVAGVID